jgi:hypothetical protein
VKTKPPGKNGSWYLRLLATEIREVLRSSALRVSERHLADLPLVLDAEGSYRR